MKTVRFSFFLFALIALNFAQDANAGGYGSLGSAWTVNTYHHAYSFIAPSGDVKNSKVLFISDTTWYDNIAVCQNNGGQITLSPGGGQSDPFRIINPDTLATLLSPEECDKRTGACTDTVTYISKVDDLLDQSLFDKFQCQGANTAANRLACFQDIFNLSTAERSACQNKNGTLVEVRTKGVCAITTAKQCDRSTTTTECAGTDQIVEGWRFTFPSFNQSPNALFTAERDDRCIDCVNNPTTSSCAP